jgi:hypothetical protein
MFPNRRLVLSLLAALALAALSLGVSACGYESHETEVAEGHAVELGELSYIVTFSRYLNPNDTEDSAYLVGQKEAPPGYTYFGVFFEIQNESEEPQRLPDSLKITDADHNEFEALPSESLYALELGGEVEEQEQVPVLDSTAQLGPIEGALALFLLPESVNEARPLILHIPGPDGEPAEVTLDL